MKSIKFTLLLLLLIVVFAYLYFSMPGGEVWWLKCPWYVLTGWQCPFCGLQRFMHALLNGDVVAAWNYNPLLWFLLPYLAFLASGNVSPRIATSRLYRYLTLPCVVIVVLTILLLWGIVRNMLV
ncbi:MAG: DUF2752 domain-containing protein [Bacteroidaceae bacterium]|nr:DUF2752 domain-containing protein [Bacteroidaceae bacterium]